MKKYWGVFLSGVRVLYNTILFIEQETTIQNNYHLYCLETTSITVLSSCCLNHHHDYVNHSTWHYPTHHLSPNGTTTSSCITVYNATISVFLFSHNSTPSLLAPSCHHGSKSRPNWIQNVQADLVSKMLYNILTEQISLTMTWRFLAEILVTQMSSHRVPLSMSPFFPSIFFLPKPVPKQLQRQSWDNVFDLRLFEPWLHAIMS